MELLESGCLKIVLSNEDLEEMGLTFDRLDYRNAENPAGRFSGCCCLPGRKPGFIITAI